MTLIWTLASLIILLLISDFCYQQYASRKIQTLIDDIQPFGVTIGTERASAVPVTITTSDGWRLEGWLYHPDTPPRGIIVFLPELNASHDTAVTYCSGLIDAGYLVLGMNFRQPKSSEMTSATSNYEPTQWVTEFELLDVAGAMNLIDADPELCQLPVGVMGVSRGGAVALLAGCRFSGIAAVVTDSGFSTMLVVQHFMYRFSRLVIPDWFFSKLPAWHVAITLRQALARSERKRGCRYAHLEQQVKSFHAPALLISGSRDSYVTPEMTRHLARLIGQPDQYWIVDKARHNKSRFVSTEAYDQRVVAHFDHAFARYSTPSINANSEAQQSDCLSVPRV